MTPDDYKAIREALITALNSTHDLSAFAATEVEANYWNARMMSAQSALAALEKYKPESEE